MEDRRAKETNRSIRRNFAWAEMPLSEWWADVPWFPGSSPKKNYIQVTDNFTGSKSRRETISLLTDGSIERAVEWYLAEMPRHGWMLVSDKTRTEDTDQCELAYGKAMDNTDLQISIHKLGRRFYAPPNARGGAPELTFALNQLMDSIDAPVLAQWGRETTEIDLTRILKGYNHPERST